MHDGSGYLRIGSFDRASGEIRDCRFDVTWHGEATLFEANQGSPLFHYDTIRAETSSGAIYFFYALGTKLVIWNSILSCSGGDSTLVSSDAALVAGQFVADCIWGFGRLADGAGTVQSLQDLNALNASSPRFAGHKNISEAPYRTFGPPVKGVAQLSPGSACVGAALPIDSEPARDFTGRPRPGIADTVPPDIGADEISE